MIGVYVKEELQKKFDNFTAAVEHAEQVTKETGVTHYAKPFQELRTKNTYELLAVRYREQENSSTMRNEFPFFEAEQAMERYLSYRKSNYAFAELVLITARRS